MSKGYIKRVGRGTYEPIVKDEKKESTLLEAIYEIKEIRKELADLRDMVVLLLERK